MNSVHTGELIFVRVLIPLVLGIIAAVNFPGINLVFYSSLVLASAAFFFFWISVANYKHFKFYLKRWIPGLTLQLFIFFITVSLTLLHTQKLQNNHFSRYSSEALVLTVTSEPKLSGDILRFEGRVTQGFGGRSFRSLSGLLLVALKLQDTSERYVYGNELLIASNFAEVEPPYNPYEFDFKNFLANRGIYHQTFINQTQTKLLKHNTGNWLIDYALRVRQKMVIKYNRYIHNKDAAAVASTLILGYRAELSKEALSAYAKTGTMHVLSVSGMHVGIVFAVLNWLLGFMDRTKLLRLIRAALIISLIWCYALVTGFSPSVSRAALMLSIYVLGKAVSRSSNSYNLVAASAVFLLIYNPYFLLDVGFQLSYLAVLGLIYFQPKIYNLLYIKNKVADKIWSYIALSCAAQLATFPLGMYYFHQFPVYFLLSNLFILAPVVVIMYAGLAFLFIPWHSILKPLGLLLEKAIVVMDEGLFYIENLPWATIKSYNGHFTYYLLMYVIITAAMLIFQYRSKVWVYYLLASCAVFAGYRFAVVMASSTEKNITFYSLRKNTAIGFFNNRQALLYTDLDSADKTMAFSILPSLEARAEEMKFLKNENVDFILNDGNFIQFKDWRILIWTPEINAMNYTESIAVHVLLLSGSPKVKLRDLLRTVKFRELLVDGTNYDYLIKRWQVEAQELSLNIHILKKNPSVTYKIN